MSTPDEPGFYLLPMDHPIAVENVRRHSSKADCVDDLFDEDELDWLWKNLTFLSESSKSANFFFFFFKPVYSTMSTWGLGCSMV